MTCLPQKRADVFRDGKATTSLYNIASAYISLGEDMNIIKTTATCPLQLNSHHASANDTQIIINFTQLQTCELHTHSGLISIPTETSMYDVESNRTTRNRSNFT